ncbi:uncharacterized protein M6B38_297335 [Iris pallida]|uniref:Mitochondrial-processing peptidase subunit beta, mitochondrial n=1 Tax=Iris pallida TaxID=29817 RepID=A0AAX6HR45_IRIPA|nr:uncharacterized protein M6B38_297335 [Iris pallida]
MATRNLLSLSRHRGPLLSLLPSRFLSTTISLPSETLTTVPADRSPPFLPYDEIACAVRDKLRKLDDPDPRFLRHASPHPSPADHSSLLSFPETKITTLDTGLRVATESSLSAQTATVSLSIDTGSRFDPDDADGTANFVRRVVEGIVVEEIGKIGGVLGGSTSKEKTVFNVEVMGKDVVRVLEVLADAIQNESAFDEGRIERERSALLREMAGVVQQNEPVIFDHLHATAFQYTPLGNTILGSAHNIVTMTKEHLKNFISSQYTAPRMVISATGAVKHEDIVNHVKKLFTKLSADPTTASQLVSKVPATFTGSEVRMIDDDEPLARFALAFSGASRTDSDSVALMVMQKMLGSWNKESGDGKHMGSELVQMIAINEIADSMRAFSTNYKDTGLFGVYAVAKPDCLDDLSYAIMYAISKLSYRVLDADVTRAQNQLKTSLLRIRGMSPLAEDIGHEILNYGRRIPVAELFARIDAVDASTIKRVANRFIFDQDVAIAAMGPIKMLPDYNWFRRRTYLLRY